MFWHIIANQEFDGNRLPINVLESGGMQISKDSGLMYGMNGVDIKNFTKQNSLVLDLMLLDGR